ncbi:MAG: RNA polymerase sigma factor [Chitinophagaceae bacterium]
MEKEALLPESLVVRCQTGDMSAAKQLYEQYSKAMYNICLRMMNNAEDAEDMLQEAFYQVFKNIGSYRGESTIGSWIKRIVVNKCINQLKKKKIVLVAADNIEYAEEERMEEDAFKYTVENVKQAIKYLPDGYRTVLNLYLFENYSHKEIAERLGISESTAKTQYMRAKQRVRKIVERTESGSSY